MVKIKSYTDLEQSKVLAKILPIESADMCYILHASSDNLEWRFDNDIPPMVLGETPINELTVEALPCWSLVALLNLMICPRLENYVEGIWDLTTFTDETLRTPIEIQDYKYPVDVCVAMIENLHRLKIL